MESRKSHGKSFILATAGVAILAWSGITFLPTDSVNAKDDKPTSSGTIACGGFYMKDSSVLITDPFDPTYHPQRVRWIFHNLNAEEPIYIDRFRVYDWDGALKWDSADTTGVYGGYLPTDLNGLIGSSSDPVNPVDNNALGPFQAAWYKSEVLRKFRDGGRVLPDHDKHTAPNPNQAHIKILVDWHADTNVYPLAGRKTRISLMPGGTSWGRSSSECRDITD